MASSGPNVRHAIHEGQNLQREAYFSNPKLFLTTDKRRSHDRHTILSVKRLNGRL